MLLLSLTGFAESKHVEVREAEHEAPIKPPAISIQPRLERFFDESGPIFGSPGDLLPRPKSWLVTLQYTNIDRRKF